LSSFSSLSFSLNPATTHFCFFVLFLPPSVCRRYSYSLSLSSATATATATSSSVAVASSLPDSLSLRSLWFSLSSPYSCRACAAAARLSVLPLIFFAHACFLSPALFSFFFSPPLLLVNLICYLHIFA
jgi:hypothetical protein